MVYPTKYARQYDFQSYQNSNPTRPLPGDKVNVDFNYVVSSIGEIVEFIKLFTASSGALANGSVGVDQLTTQLKANLGDTTTLASIDASVAAAAASETAAATSATSAAASATSAGTSATNAASSETAAGTSEANAATSETNAATSETNAAASATQAANAAGVIGARWSFESSTTMGAPATGGLRFNNATVASVTSIAVAAQDAESGNPDISDYVASWDDSTNTVKGYLVIRKLSAPATYAVFTVSVVTDNGTWLQIDVAHESSAGTWTAADTMAVGFTRAGDKGADGTVSGPGVSVDGEIALWSGTGGAALKRATGTGVAKLTSGVLGTATAGSDYLAPPSGTALLKANSGGALANAVADTDYLTPSTAASSYEALGKTRGSNAQTASYTLALTDAGKPVRMNVGSANNLTVPPNSSVAFPVDSYVNVEQYGAGQTTVVAGVGVTVRSRNGLKLGGQYAMATLHKIGTDEWMLGGDVTT